MSDELEVCRAANERLLRELSAARAEITRLGALLDAAKEVRASDKAEIKRLKSTDDEHRNIMLQQQQEMADEIARLQKQRRDLIEAMEFYQRPGERVAVREVVAIARDRTWYQDGHGNWKKTVLLFEASGKIDIPCGSTVTIRPTVPQDEQEETS